MTSLSTPRPRRRHDAIEILEARIAPATLVSLDSTTHLLTVQGDYVDDGSGTVQPGGADETLAISVTGGNLVIMDSNHGVTAVGAGLVQAGIGEVDLPLAAFTGSISIATGTGADTLSFSGALILATDHSLTAHTTGTISFTANSTVSATGAGSISLTTTRDISVAGGANLKVVDGSLSLTATGAVSGNYTGISMDGSIVSNGSGALTLDGLGGDTGSNNLGVDLHGQISAQAGLITLHGRGGVGGVDANSGVGISGTIVAGTGGLTLRGTPGTDAGQSLGIDLASAITSGGDVHFEGRQGAFV